MLLELASCDNLKTDEKSYYPFDSREGNFSWKGVSLNVFHKIHHVIRWTFFLFSSPVGTTWVPHEPVLCDGSGVKGHLWAPASSM
jgi:hypothetical protein